jgi:hypothetical protein
LLSQHVGDGQHLICLLVEQEVMVAEVGPGGMPVEVLDLRIQSERVRKQGCLRPGVSQYGPAGMEGEALLAGEASGVERMRVKLCEMLLGGRYRPQAIRRVGIPKPGAEGVPPARDSARPG